jgi:hypothetical protein
MRLYKLSGILSESIRNLEVFHGGSSSKGKIVTYYTTSIEMAKSYAEMHNDRFGSGSIHKSAITINNPAPTNIVDLEAKKIGIDNEHYTPASVFDHNLHGEKEIITLVRSLKKLGYDGAVLEDIGYGVEAAGKVYIVFT